MKKCAPFFFLLALLLLSGCGGAAGIGSNSTMLIHLQRTNPSQIMTDYEVYITQMGNATLDETDPEAFASTTNQPTWSDAYTSTRTASELRLGFRTRSTEVPYFVWVKVPATGAGTESLSFRIDVDGKAGKTITLNQATGTTQRLFNVRINRDNATY